ncbi:hypothetical protein LTR10_019599 [Elasticomyces elasticus]|uniref:Uncharacterized protein n=1 Tax=Exophiala sideris TaxID=1016849 RepID=A0ABR0JQB3_9EURO|nr:hypothetical protein LTR10_019599 [Elasticomyces elasticus]KAK5038135.1 hypothetical protein LTS07_001604 [Exophiala sideris]KAK5044119.1 hypothetical protein LTR13_000475 [Exophiala sideris]KAK5067619.1 hypothetical protein LTR69_001608 [Exophiala sideris]
MFAECTYQLPNGLSGSDDPIWTNLNTTLQLATDRLANISQFAFNFSGVSREEYNMSFNAFDCVIYSCVNILTAKAVSGQLVESISDSLLPYHWENGTPLYDTDIVFTLSDDAFSALEPGAARTHGFGGVSRSALNFYLSNALNGSVSGANPINEPVPEGVMTDTLMAMYTNYGSNLSQAITNLATSMGNQVRQSSGLVANGTTLSMETYVEAATWIVFLAVLLVTVKRKVPVWKDNALAVMTWGVDKADLRREAAALGVLGLDKSDEMDEVADQLFARMVKDSKGNWLGLKVVDKTGTYSHATAISEEKENQTQPPNRGQTV